MEITGCLGMPYVEADLGEDVCAINYQEECAREKGKQDGVKGDLR